MISSIKSFRSTWNDFTTIPYMHIRTTTLVLVLAVVYILPIILAHNFFNDDIGRITDSYYLHTNTGRPIGQLIALLETVGSPNISIYPYNQLVAAAVVAIAALCTVFKFFQGSISHAALILLTVCFFVNPFLIETFLFQFDSIQFAVSIAISMFAFVYYLTSDKPSFLLCCLLLVIASLAYFPTTQVFLTLLLLIYAFNPSLPVKYDVVARAIPMLLAFMISALIAWYFMNHVGANSYIHRQASFTNSIGHDWIHVLVDRWKQLIRFAALPMHNWYGIVWGLVFLVGTFAFVTNTIVTSKSMKAACTRICIVFVLAPVAMFGSLLVSSNSTYLQARYLIGFSFPMMLFVGSIFLTYKRWQPWARRTVSVLTVYALVLSYSLSATIGQGLYLQRDYVQKIAFDVATNLNIAGFDARHDKLGILGQVTEPPTITAVRHSSPFASTIIRNPLRKNSWFTRSYLNMYGAGLYRYARNPSRSDDMGEIVVRSGIYTIRKKERVYWLEFH